MTLISPMRGIRPLIAALLLLIASTLAAAPAHAASGMGIDYDISIDLTIRSDDTYHAKITIVDSSEPAIFTQDNCTAAQEASNSNGSVPDGATATFTEEDGKRTCVIEGSEPISQSDGTIAHESDEYVVDMSSASGDTGAVEIAYSVTFPGEVTEAAGGEVEGNTVSFDKLQQQVVRGKDSAGLPWMWILIGLLIVAAVVGAIVAIVLKGKKKQTQQAQLAQPYAAPGQPGEQYPQQPSGQYPPQGQYPQQPGGQYPPQGQYPQQ
ncbi:LppM family (lipo)protein [Actinomyces bowdenii]|uniref:LppM domain-containing protein n=1 Tax=Actinomyces bowdenii TaxID=131109 RepID=A0A3P1VBX0_9ACTO|nr:hypothetical protein [Actinomyces bowdenii]RRD30915.1 hypothetical protein EII10_02195 [Actinomyces bowdenii]